ncbi:unnamed protein product [Paramecium sonneborni]|uniref:Uncharacterized protein n=1 Tax=Paramecium sonneborni TaxID=65129 RepID=A0A8S1LY90_9CILI|nr:unnamed protein product [Paramecium sonneborni]
MIQFDNNQTHRPSIARYELMTRPSTTSTFSRTFRKTQLLRKLDIVQQTKKNELIKFMCSATRSPLNFVSRNKRQQSISCQTEESMSNRRRTLHSCRQLINSDSNNPTYRVKITNNNLKNRRYQQKGSLERFKLIEVQDNDFQDYMQRQFRKQYD